MNSNLLSWLLSTGLDEQRAEIYLTCLSFGEATAKDLARKLKMGRTAVYDNLRVLEERGYVKTILSGKRKMFIPLHPKELYKKFENLKLQLKDLLPDFLSLYAGESACPFVQIFTGKYAAREVYEDILATTKKEYVYFSPPELTYRVIDKNYMKKWIDRRVKKNILSRALRVRSREILDIEWLKPGEKYLRQVRYLPEYVDLKSSMYIYENNIGVISTIHEGSAFIIYSPDMAYGLRKIFEFMWGIAPRQ